MTGCLYFYDINVYRISEKEYHKEMDAYINKNMNIKENHDFFKKYPECESTNRNFYSKKFGGMWRYNEIIGFIRLHVLGTQVRGEYYNTDSKKIVKTRKKQFIYSTHKLAIEKELPLKGSNQEIYRAILIYLENCKKEKKLLKRFVDTSVFEKIGPFVDWKKLIG